MKDPAKGQDQAIGRNTNAYNFLPIHAKSDLPKMRFKAQIREKSIDVPSLMHIIILGKEHPPCVYMTQKY